MADQYDDYDEYDDYDAYGEGDYDYTVPVPPAPANLSGGGGEGSGADADVVADARTMSIEQALEMQAAVVDDVARLTCLSASAATLLLNSYLWAKDITVERYFEDVDGVLQRLSLTPETAANTSSLCAGKPATVTTCDICACEYGPEEVCCLSTCGHYFCRECWQDHIRSHLHDNLMATRCPAQHCKELVGLQKMVALFDNNTSAASVLKDIQREYLASYVQACPSLFWCPNNAGCAGIIYVGVTPLQGQGVTCDLCRETFCLRCADKPHRPATCSNLRSWRQYCSAEGANVAFILVKTKRCPQCHKDIEKNGGCNHMTCKCGFQFCWVCGKAWASHSGDYYSCKNAESSKQEPMTEDVRKSKRFMYHYERFTMHLDSASRDVVFIDNYTKNAILVDAAERAVRQGAHESGTSPYPVEAAIGTPEVISLIKTTLVSARQVLAYAYVQLYYQEEDSNEGMLMTHRVGKLEEATEELSGKIAEYLRMAKAQLGPMLDTVNIVNRWQKVVREC